MKVLLAEYTVFADPALAPEGRSMLGVLTDSFLRCGYEIITPESGNFNDELERLAPECDMGLVIAPDHLLAQYTRIIEAHTQNLGCGSVSCAVCANKQLSGKILSAHDIAVPMEKNDGMRVIKEKFGCGTQNMRLSDEGHAEGEFGQEFIDGDHLSVSLIANRIVGEGCLRFSGNDPTILALNRQHIEIDKGNFHYLGGETPVIHPKSAEIIETAKKVTGILGCQGYIGIDMVVSDAIYVVDVNPRITSSIVGIAAVMEEEIADLLVSASYGRAPTSVHLRGHAMFDRTGSVKVE